ncbi:MAG: ComEC/Rec2 family competence protein [Candidatus Omnitrophota bacterium]|nr:MAG: ComEC/Rec2 family competence protein [Candidatus Omnitrophota bacterium]
MKNKYLASLLPFCIFLVFATGIILGHYLAHFFTLLITALIFLLLVYIFYKRKNILFSDILLLVFFFFVGGAWHASASRNIDPFLYKESVFRLKVVSLPEENQLRNTLYAQIKEIGGAPAQTRVKVFDYTKSLEYLHSYEAEARLSRKKYQERLFYSLWIKKSAFLRELPMGLSDSLREKGTRYLLKVFKDNVDSEAYRFLAAVFLGRRELLEKERDLFSRAGVSHLLAISGLHIGLTALILFFVLRIFCASFRVSLIISVFFLWCYTLLAGASSATVRAVIMYSVFALSFLAKRRVNVFNALGLAGITILFIRPSSVFEVGFQLSFFSVLSIIIGYKIFSFKSFTILPLDYAKNILLVSLYVMIGITPLISYYFGRVYFFSFLYNVLLIPLFTLILAINFVLILFSFFSFIAFSIGSVLSIFISFFVNLTRFLGSFSWSFASFRFSGQMMLGYYMFLAAILVISKTGFGRKTLKKIKIGVHRKRVILPSERA